MFSDEGDRDSDHAGEESGGDGKLRRLTQCQKKMTWHSIVSQLSFFLILLVLKDEK